MATDLEQVKDSFLELKRQQHAIMVQLQGIEEQLSKRAATKRRASLTAQEISETPEDTNLFKQIGRGYALTPRSEVLKALENEVENSDTAARNLQEQAEVLQKKMKQLKSEINDLIHSQPAVMKTIREEYA